MKRFLSLCLILSLCIVFGARAEGTPTPAVEDSLGPTPTPISAASSENTTGVLSCFTDMWRYTKTIGTEKAYVVTREGKLYSWDYTDAEPESLGDLPIIRDDLFTTTYSQSSADIQAEAQKAITALTADSDTLYALNPYAGKIGVVENGGISWNLSFDNNWVFVNDEERAFEIPILWNGFLCTVVSYWQEDPNALYCSRITLIDLATGAVTQSESGPWRNLCAYGDQLLVLGADESEASALYTFDPATSAAAPLPITLPSSDPEELQCLAWDETRDIIYLSTNAGIYVSESGSDFRLIMALPTAYAYGAGLVLPDGRYVLQGDGIFAVDTASAAQTEHTTLNVRTSFGDDATLRTLFTEANPSAFLNVQTDSSLTASDIANAVRSGETSVDVFSAKVNSGFSLLKKKGYLGVIDNADIVSAVQDMNPTLRALCTNNSGEVIAYPWSMMITAWEVNQTLFEKYFPGQDLPSTWVEFFDLMLAFEDVDNNEDGDLFLMDWNYTDMLTRVLESFIYTRSFSGGEVNFSDPDLLETLNKLAEVHQRLLDRGVEEYHEEEIFWYNEVIGGNSIFSTGFTYSTHNTFYGKANALSPFVFSESDTPVWQGQMTMLVVNPLSEHQDLAESYLAGLTAPSCSDLAPYLFSASISDPYEDKWTKITAEDIDTWRGVLQRTGFGETTPLLSDEFSSQAATLLQEYAGGRINANDLLTRLSKIADMILSEEDF